VHNFLEKVDQILQPVVIVNPLTGCQILAMKKEA